MATKEKVYPKSKGRKNGVLNYNDEQLLAIIAKRLPVDISDWAAVAKRYLMSTIKYSIVTCIVNQL